jgi:Omp85 superfamily domain
MYQRNVYLETVNLALLMTCLGLVLFGKPIQAQAQEPHATRQELLKQQRIAKAQKLQDEQRGGLEKAALYIQKQKVLERLAQGWKGFHPVFGGLATGSGIAGGLRFAPTLLDGALEFEVLGAISTRTYQLYELRLGAPSLGNGRFFVDFYGNYRSGNRLPFFGLGPDSSNQDRTSFSAEFSTYDVTAGVNWTRWLSTGVRAGYLRTNVGPGKDSRFPSTEDIFTPAQAPALEVQPHFYHTDAFLTVDYLDSIGNPMAGGAYQLSYSYFDDQKVGLHTFRRLDAHAQQYFPFLNKKRVIALRARTSLTDRSPGQSIPFYMQEYIGGAESLRGFREFRFRE